MHGAGYFYLYDGILLKSMTFSQTSLEMSVAVGDGIPETMNFNLNQTLTAHRRPGNKQALN